jgi:Ribonuclease G/E
MPDTTCPLCSGTGHVPTDTTEAVVHELRPPADPAWRADMHQLLRLLHRAVIDDNIERDAERARRRSDTIRRQTPNPRRGPVPAAERRPMKT